MPNSSICLFVKGALRVFVSCLLIHVLFALDVPCYIINTEQGINLVVAVNPGVGASLLLIPLLVLADLWFIRNKIIQAALAILVIILISTLVVFGKFIIFCKAMLESPCNPYFHSLKRHINAIAFLISSFNRTI